MTKEQELNRLYELKKKLEVIPALEEKLEEAKEHYNEVERDYTKRNWPEEPEEPQAPIEPTKPVLKKARADDREGWQYLLMLMFWPITVIVFIVKCFVGEQAKLDKQYRKEIMQYNKDMEQYNKDKAQYDIAYEKWDKDWEAWDAETGRIAKSNKQLYKIELDAEYKKIEYAEKELEEAKKAVADDDILSASEKNIKAVEFIIDKIQSRRADSIKEALIAYDAYTKQIVDAEIQRWNNELQRERDAKKALDDLQAKYRLESEIKELRKSIEKSSR